MVPAARREHIRPLPALVALLVAGLFVPLGALAVTSADLAEPHSFARSPDAAGSVPTAASTDAGPPQDTSILPSAINEQTVVIDDAGDTTLMFEAPNPVPPGDQDAPADILELRVAEGEDAFRFSLKHRAYPATEAQLSEAIIFRQLDCQIEFRLNGRETTVWTALVSGENVLDGGDWVFFADARLRVETENSFTSEYITELETAFVGGDHIEVIWPKDLFTYSSGFRESNVNSTELKLGDQLGDFAVICQKWQTLLVWFEDRAEGSGPTGTYTVSVAPRTREISLSFGSESAFAGFDLGIAPTLPLAIPVGEKSRVEVAIRNLVDRKILVNLTAEVIDQTGTPLAGWTVQNTPTLTVRAANSTQATLVVAAPPDAQHRQGGYLRVRALPLGFDHAATLSRPLYAVESPNVENNILYFHQGPAFQYCFICLAGQNVGGDIIDPAADLFYLNVLPDDPEYPNTATTSSTVALFDDPWDFAFMDLPTAHAMRFDPDGFIELQVALRSAVARDIRFEAYLSANEGEIGGAAQTISVTEGFNTYTFAMPVPTENLEMPAGTSIMLQTRVRENQVAINGGAWIAGVDWDPGQSRITLPLVPIERPEFNVTDGRALPTISLANGTDREDYINPGRSTAFDLVLTNQGLEKDVLSLGTSIKESDWTSEFAPGKRFDLAPGATAPVCVTVRAPDSATEGQVVNATVTATSKIDPNVKTTTQLRLIVTSGVEIDDRTCSAIAPEDLVMPFDDEKKGSPGTSLAAVLVAALAALVVLRRRRDV